MMQPMSNWIGLIPPRRAMISLGINVSKALGVSRKQRACHAHLRNGAEFATRNAIESFELIQQYLPDLAGLAGLEIGPGDNLGVAECCLANGAAHMVCVEQFATVHESHAMHELISDRYGPHLSRPELISTPFESVACSVDFIYSIDVLEHVASVPAAICHMKNLLKPGGIAVHSVDFAGHNTFAGTGIDFLSCPDWVWSLLHSKLQTTNRIRYGELINAILSESLELVSAVPIKTVGKAEVELLRSKMLPRYRSMSTEDLSVLQAVIAFKKPVALNHTA